MKISVLIMFFVEVLVLSWSIVLQGMIATTNVLDRSGLYNQHYSLHTLHTHTFNVADTGSNQLDIVPQKYNSILPTSVASHQLGRWSYPTFINYWTNPGVTTNQYCTGADRHYSSGCARMSPMISVQYFNEDGASVVSSVSPGVYLITLLAILSWYVLCTVFDISNKKQWVLQRHVLKRVLQFIIVCFYAANLVKYSNNAGMNTVKWSEVSVATGLELWMMTVNYFQSTNMASVLVSITAFLLCVWANMGHARRWSKMTVTIDSTVDVPLAAYKPGNGFDKQQELYSLLPTQQQNMLSNSMLNKSVNTAFNVNIELDRGQSSQGYGMSADSTNDTIYLYGFVLFFVLVQQFASRAAVCLETQLQCLIGVTLIFIVVELAYTKVYNFFWEMVELDVQADKPALTGEADHVMHLHYVFWAIRSFVCAFELILLATLRELYLADGHALSSYFNTYYVFGLLYVIYNLFICVIQLLAVLANFTCQNPVASSFLPMKWFDTKEGKHNRRRLRWFSMAMTPVFYTLLILITMIFCYERLTENGTVTKSANELYASLTEQYLKANNYVGANIEAGAAAECSLEHATPQQCGSEGTCASAYLTDITKFALINPDVDELKDLKNHAFKYNSWQNFMDPFHMKIGFWTKFLEIREIVFSLNKQAKWTARGSETSGVLCNNFFTFHNGVDCVNALARKNNLLAT